jgi:esterase/lipase superfamily enzyme
MPYFMMSNRKLSGGEPGEDCADTMNHYFAKDSAGSKLTQFTFWEKVSASDFRKLLTDTAMSFPEIADDNNESQKHVSLFVHGYNVGWKDAAARYADLGKRLYSGAKSLGTLVLYTWPSNGSVAGYLPDREDARASAPVLADALVTLHDHIIAMQRLAALNPGKQCKAKISVIAHSMGNYVMQNALAIAAKKLNSPQLITLVHQLVMVAADVDNDIFQKDQPGASDGSLMSNLCYRIGALYTGLDQVLGASAGLKHFGTRRLGRSGIADRDNVWDNVFDLDVTDFIDQSKSIHSAALESPKSVDLIRQILTGVDRGFLPQPKH